MRGSSKPISAVSAVVAAGVVFVALLAWRSRGWPLIHDVALMHYVAWRIGEGAIPYRDLFDMNQPGTYLIHLAVLRALGGGDLAWRLLDLGWLAATAGAIAVFAAPWGALASAAGALLFATYHLAGGPWQAGQRDFLLCLFLIVGALGVVRWLERRRLVSLVWSGAVLGAGISVKPHAALFAGALAAVVAIAAARACGAAPAGAARAGRVGAGWVTRSATMSGRGRAGLFASTRSRPLPRCSSVPSCRRRLPRGGASWPARSSAWSPSRSCCSVPRRSRPRPPSSGGRARR